MVHSWSLLNGVDGSRSDRTLKTTPDGQFRGVNSGACQANFSLFLTTKPESTQFEKLLQDKPDDDTWGRPSALLLFKRLSWTMMTMRMTMTMNIMMTMMMIPEADYVHFSCWRRSWTLCLRRSCPSKPARRRRLVQFSSYFDLFYDTKHYILPSRSHLVQASS